MHAVQVRPTIRYLILQKLYIMFAFPHNDVSQCEE